MKLTHFNDQNGFLYSRGGMWQRANSSMSSTGADEQSVF